ncbi:DUF885 family protein [Ideonella sp. A 288]|uniref:DUF885 domain-containing protein n=1 Tax=Ideonella sp. A 288 TaxID=1962181 RepID=UPI000B4B686F|nr:DUF885 domain-containing protein [Ideonella sp. A 288]
MIRRTALLLPALALALLLPTTLRAADPAAPAEAGQALHALFERQWDWSARSFPEWATYRGDLRFNDQLSDLSAAAEAARDRDTAGFLAEARAVRREALSPTDRVSLDLFIDSQQRQLEWAAFPAAQHMSLRVLGGPQSDFAELMSIAPMQRPDQAAQALARMAALPRLMDQQIELLRASAKAGWVPARGVLERVLAQIDTQFPAQVDDSPHFAPFKRLGRDIPAADQAALQADARTAIATHVVPALRRLRALVVDELMPKAPTDGSLSRYPDGAAVYAMLVRHRTTTDLSPAQIHAIGQRELARLRAEMEAVMRETRFEGSFAQFVHFLNTDPRFIAAGPEALLAGYREIAKRVDAELPRLFAELPRAPYGVQAMPAHMGANRAEYYSGPALDGSRAGFFFANTISWRTRPTWGMETLVAHEAVPGHHLQIARASELRGLPAFRRGSWGYTAFTEGWGLYAETLGFELGLYTDPYSRFGHLMWQAFRAARLVVDTGIHQLGWPRQKAIDFMTERTGVDLAFVESEIDRYTSEPGQALAYMIGKLKFDELRDRAKARLGARFDIRRFHNAVLDQGALPLNVLDRLTDEWIAAEAARAG